MTATTAQDRRLAIWNRMTPEQRDYDRFVAGQIPQGASWLPETHWGWTEGSERRASMIEGPPSGCSCHINPPCSYCESLEECETCGEFLPGDEMAYDSPMTCAACDAKNGG